ncbi:hypothetical protein ACE6H2_019771 [Prunus campanulata]
MEIPYSLTENTVLFTHKKLQIPYGHNFLFLTQISEYCKHPRVTNSLVGHASVPHILCKGFTL